MPVKRYLVMRDFAYRTRNSDPAEEPSVRRAGEEIELSDDEYAVIAAHSPGALMAMHSKTKTDWESD